MRFSPLNCVSRFLKNRPRQLGDLLLRISDSGYRILAVRILRKQVKQLVRHLAGVRTGPDIESIHRARIASRRLRTALDMFRDCWKRKRVNHWKKQIRRLAQNLSEARDCDVQIDFLASSLAGVSDRLLVPGIAALLSHIERQRLWIQPRVLKAINRFENSGVSKAMQAAARSTGHLRSGLADADKVDFVAGAYARCRGHHVLMVGKSVRKSLKKLFAECAALAAPEQHERHHAMRIAAKRLRYALEFARPVYAPGSGGDASDTDQAAGVQGRSHPCASPGTITPVCRDLVNTADAIKKLQTFLGEVHDCDVWAEDFAEFAHEAEGEIQLYFGGSQRFEHVRPGLEYLRQDRKDCRSQVFGELAAFWQELKDRGLWDRLATILECGGDRARSPENGEVRDCLSSQA